MKIILSESQIKRLIESNTSLDNINNYLNKNLDPYRYHYALGESFVIPSRIILDGDLTDKDITVRVGVDKVYFNGQDVTKFAKDYALFSHDFENDTLLSSEFKNYLADKLNERVLKMVSTQITDFDVILEL